LPAQSAAQGMNSNSQAGNGPWLVRISSSAIWREFPLDLKTPVSHIRRFRSDYFLFSAFAKRFGAKDKRKDDAAETAVDEPRAITT